MRNLPKREREREEKYNGLKLVSCRRGTSPQNHFSLQSSPINHTYHSASMCGSAYVTVTLDLIKKHSAVQDFKTGREEGPELLAVAKRDN